MAGRLLAVSLLASILRLSEATPNDMAATTSTANDGKEFPIWAIVVIVLGVVLIPAIAVACYVCIIRRKRAKAERNRKKMGVVVGGSSRKKSARSPDAKTDGQSLSADSQQVQQMKATDSFKLTGSNRSQKSQRSQRSEKSETSQRSAKRKSFLSRVKGSKASKSAKSKRPKATVRPTIKGFTSKWVQSPRAQSPSGSIKSLRSHRKSVRIERTPIVLPYQPHDPSTKEDPEAKAKKAGSAPKKTPPVMSEPKKASPKPKGIAKSVRSSKKPRGTDSSKRSLKGTSERSVSFVEIW